MKRIVKRLAIFIGIFSLLLFILFFAFAQLFEDQIQEQVLKMVNEQVKTEVSIQDFDLSLFRSFPNVGANLKDIRVLDTKKKTLLEAQELSFRIALFSLFKDNIKIKSAVLNKGTLNIKITPRGNANYDILKEAETSATQTEESELGIELTEALLQDININYIDLSSKTSLALNIQDAVFAGAFGSDHYQLDSEAELLVNYLLSEDEKLISDQSISYQTALDINTAEAVYEIKRFDLNIGELPLELTGAAKAIEQGYDIQMDINSNGGQLADLIKLLPKEQIDQMADITTRGDFSVSGQVQGVYTDKQMPKIDIDIDFEDGRISADRIQSSIKDLSFYAHYTNGKQRNSRSSEIEISSFKGQFGGETFELNANIKNFTDPQLQLQANGALALGSLLPFIEDERLSTVEGYLLIDQLKLNGEVQDMSNSRKIQSVDLSGKLTLKDALFNINDSDVELKTGSLHLMDNKMMVDNLNFTAPGTDLVFNGQVNNLLPVLLADSLNSQAASFVFDAQLHAQSLDIDELLALGAPSAEAIQAAEAAGQEEELEEQEVAKRAHYTRFLNGQFEAQIDAFNYEKIEGQDFKGSLVFDPQKVNISGQTKAMEGQLSLEGEMHFTEAPSLTAKLICEKVAANAFFEQSDNFGQDVLVADNLEGLLDAHLFIECAFDKAGNFLSDQLHVLGGIGIHDGVLKDFKMLEDFSAFVDIRDLRRIQFTNLQNFFEIRNSTLFLPVMFIQSNALNLTISGQHTFEQDIAYYLKVNAGQVLANKFKRHNPDLRPKPAQRKGFFNLHYAILGNLDDYHFSADKKRVIQDFEESELRKRDVHFALEKAMGTIIEYIEEPLEWRSIPEHKEDPDSEEEEYLDMEIDGGL